MTKTGLNGINAGINGIKTGLKAIKAGLDGLNPHINLVTLSCRQRHYDVVSFAIGGQPVRTC